MRWPRSTRLAERDFDDRPSRTRRPSTERRPPHPRSPRRTSRGSSADTPPRRASRSVPPGGSGRPTCPSRRDPGRAPTPSSPHSTPRSRTSGDEIARQREHVAGMATADEAEIFDAHLLFLKDDALLAPTRAAIAEGASGRPGVARRDRTDGGALGRARRRLPARASGRPPERRATGARAPPRRRAPGTRARGTRHRGRARPDTRRHGRARPVDGARDRHRRGRPDLARGRARALVGDPRGRRRRRQRALRPRGNAGRARRIDGVVYVDPEASVVSELTAAREARDASSGGAGVGPRTGPHDRRR